MTTLCHFDKNFVTRCSSASFIIIVTIEKNEAMNIEKQAKFLSRRWRKYKQDEETSVSASIESVHTIESKLGIFLPPEYILVSQTALNYRAWFAGIGSDYDSQEHILVINK
ncbi:hypothetical protein QUF74_11660 [Candidatus Halobeggiatoa sp. HSG11]|nr:hypothetical protein [Candidatus Halobeggiatoa sp. HSG11]